MKRLSSLKHSCDILVLDALWLRGWLCYRSGSGGIDPLESLLAAAALQSQAEQCGSNSWNDRCLASQSEQDHPSSSGSLFVLGTCIVSCLSQPIIDVPSRDQAQLGMLYSSCLHGHDISCILGEPAMLQVTCSLDGEHASSPWPSSLRFLVPDSKALVVTLADMILLVSMIMRLQPPAAVCGKTLQGLACKSCFPYNL